MKFGNDVSLEQINNLITGYSYKIIGESNYRIFRIEINDKMHKNEGPSR